MTTSISPSLPMFDGHNDALLRLWLNGASDPAAAFVQGTPDGHLDLPRCLRGGFAGGLFAAFVPPPSYLARHAPAQALPERSDDLPTPAESRAITLDQLAILRRIEVVSGARARLCRSVADIRRCIAQGTIAMVMHLEGADALDTSLSLLEELHTAGLRSLGPVWNRRNAFGTGIQGRFPEPPAAGAGLTPAGKRLIQRCLQLRIMVDVSHMDATGFWQTAELGGAPLVATYSNAYALCPQPRNLTDAQLAAIRQSGGFVGVNFGTAFLRADGKRTPDTGVDEIVRHIDYLLHKVGEDGVGLGSDFDGVNVPGEMADVAGLPLLAQALARQGYDRALQEKIAYGNWLRVLERTWKC
ncbi:dipeptidase [Sodalis praecaptivus]|uniref:dipeptidase n=1 Tax=Sodalis praecaptivus TaxID=1239307 RepID=UPI0027F30BDE|nr:dipeptidase [Sodalis praecaptivus]CAJ0994317.1 hypothetical protein NVIRENTERO_01358 [Sodalis praecaptivus]